MMGIEEFRATYLRLCKEHHVEPQESLLNQLGVSQKSPPKSGGFCLNLSTLSLTSQTCAVLGKVLPTDRTFSDIRLNDCMLTEEAIRSLALGLAQNVSCKKLGLKGNNIRGTATEGLGRMLKHNGHLLSLCLEWNAMGMLDTAFSVFCDGLATNSCLQSLDLRNNQISHDGAAELGAALRRNTSLKTLDLRWNNIGLLGGRAILNALDYNKNLVRIEIAGNNTPTDILRAIETAVGHNAERATLTSDFKTRTHMLSKELQQVKKNRQSEMVELLDKIDKQEDAMKKSSRGTSARIQQLQESLTESKEQFNNIVAKLAMTESELALTESKNVELGALMGKAKEEQQTMAKVHQTELRREREEKALCEAKLNKELIEVNEKNMQLQNQLDELERKCRSQQENLYELKEQLTHSQADFKLKATHMEEMLSLEKQKTKDAYRDADAIRQKEIERVRREADDTEASLKDRIQKLEMQRIELEEDVSRQRSQVAAEKINAEEMLLSAKQRIKNEEEQRLKQLEDKIRLLQLSKDDVASHSAQQASTITDMQTRNSNLVLENEGLRRRIEDLQQELTGKNNETMEEVSKVRLDLNRRIEKLEAERQTKADLYDKIAALEKELSESTSSHRTKMDGQDREIQMLREKLTMREAEIKQMKEADIQRATMLQTAIQNYIGKSYTSS